MFSKSLLTRLKPYLRWVILGGTLFFIVKALRDNWQDVAALQITAQTWSMLAIAFGSTLIAHIWAGWVWHWILTTFDQPVGPGWSTQVYLKTNVVKYLPGNVWHFYGRVRALQSVGTPVNIAIVSVVMEPLMMAAAALIVVCLAGWQLNSALWQAGQIIVLCVVLIGVHPRVFNPILQKLSKAKAEGISFEEVYQKETHQKKASQSPLNAYPLRPLLGELTFVALRSLGFIFAIAALQPLTVEVIQPLVTAFSLAWLLGLVVPGAPGGIGIFEATIISLLGGQFPAAILLGGVAFYRLLSTLAEVVGAALAWVSEKTIGSVPSE